MWVPRLIEACVPAVVSPAMRGEIGTAATLDLRGSACILRS